MRLNTRGDALGRGHVNGVDLPAIGGTDYCWLTDVVPACAAGNTLQKYDGAWHVLESHGANFFRAGKGRYFSEGGGWAPTDVDPGDGTAVLTHYDIGKDIRLLAMDGSVREIATGVLGRDAIAYHNVRRRFGFLLYQAAGVWWLTNDAVGHVVPIASRVEFVDYAVPVVVSGAVLLLERANGRLTLRYPSSANGWVVHQDQASDGLVVPDGMQVGPKAVRVTWSNKQSESSAVWGVKDLPLDASQQIDLNAQTLPPVEAIPLIGRPFGVCCYSFYDAEGVGQILLPIRPGQTQWGKPIVLPSDRPDLAAGNYLWAVYAGENAGLTYEAAIQQARPLGNSLGRGLLCYKDSYPLPASAQLKPHDIAGCILKRESTETVDQFKTRCRGTTGEWPSLHLVDTDVRSCDTFQAFCEVANEGRWTGFSIFAAGRDGVPWDALKPRLDRFMSGITGTPAARIIPETPEEHMRIFMYDPTKKANDKGWVKYDDVEGTKPGQCLGTKVVVPGAAEGGFGIKKKNGKVRALNPNGDWEERDAVGGDISKPGQSWELFYQTRPGGISAPRDNQSYYFETTEQV